MDVFQACIPDGRLICLLTRLSVCLQFSQRVKGEKTGEKRKRVMGRVSVHSTDVEQMCSFGGCRFCGEENMERES
jgi:hypothetical protein